jgi:peroxiredoxin
MKTINTLIALMLTGSSVLLAQGYRVGDKVSDFRLKSTEGKMVSLADYGNAKGVVVIFTCNHCPYAKAYEERIIAIHRQYEPKGFPVVAINPNDPAVQPEDSYEQMKARAKEKAFPFAYLFDEGQRVYPLFGATKTPHVYLLSRKGGDFVVEYIGTLDDNYKDATAVKEKYLENAINSLLAGKEPALRETKAVGCSIKVKKE